MSLALAVDLGGTNIRAALVDSDGTLHHRITTATPSQTDGPTVVAAIARTAQDVLAAARNPAIAGIGVCTPGPLDTVDGKTYAVPTIKGFDRFPLRQTLQDAMPQQVRLENDGIAAAIGEWKHGAGRGAASIVYVTVSTGIGGGVIVDGHVLRGAKGMAGHVGHLAIEASGRRCGCGNRGCWEAYASGPVFAADVRKLAAQNPHSSLHAIGESLSPKDVFAAAAKGDAIAQQAVNEQARLLGVGITSLLHLYSPERVIIGGGLSQAFDQLAPGINAYVQDNAMVPFRTAEIVKASLGGDSGLVGAGVLALSPEI